MTSSSVKTNKSETIICTTTEKDDKNNILKLDISNLVIKKEMDESPITQVKCEKQKIIKQEVKNIMAVNLLRNVKTKGNVKMILCKRGPNLDAGTSGSSKITQNITTDTKMVKFNHIFRIKIHRLIFTIITNKKYIFPIIKFIYEEIIIKFFPFSTDITDNEIKFKARNHETKNK